MKINAKTVLKSALLATVITAALSLSGCAVRVAPARGPVVVKPRPVQRTVRVVHPRPVRRNIVVIRR